MTGHLSKHPGFTLTELKIALLVLSVVAVFTFPKVQTIKEDRNATGMIRESFAAVGEAFLARLQDSDLPPEDIGVNERALFGQYLFNRLNTQQAINPASVADYCTANDYFQLEMGATIRRICDVNTTTPATLQVTIRVPRNQGTSTTDFVMAIPKGEERYTTLYGLNPTLAANCGYADRVLRVTDTCP